MRLKASVIIPAYNAADTIGRCVAALARQTVARDSYEVLVVDDGSTDATAAIARAAGATVLALPRNQGRSVARNTGIAHAGAPILLFTDADCEPTPNWIEAMLRPFADPAVLGVKGAYLCRQRAPVARFTQLELEEKYAVMAQQATIEFIDTYSAGYRRELFQALGGFDSAVEILEDQDFSFRVARTGARMVFNPEARVYHRHLATPGAYYRRKVQIGWIKPVVMARYPERLSADSRTPMTQKLQFALAFPLTLLLPLAPFLRPARWAAAALLALLGLSAAPLAGRAARRDPGILWAVPPMVLLRALGLAHGYAIGLWQHRSALSDQRAGYSNSK